MSKSPAPPSPHMGYNDAYQPPGFVLKIQVSNEFKEAGTKESRQ